MGLVNFVRGEQQRQLEMIISGLEQKDINARYLSDGRTEATPVFIIPGEVQDGKLQGYFRIEGSVGCVPIGFARREGLFSTKYYEVRGTSIVEVEQRQDRLYLPIVETGYKVNAANAFYESRYNLQALGIEGRKKLPFVIAVSNGMETECYGLCAEDGKPHLYQPRQVNIAQLRAKIAEIYRNGSEKFALQVRRGEPGQLVLVERDNIFDWNNPRSIAYYLDEYVIGQQEAKKALAVAFSTYMLRKERKDPKIPKKNPLLIGPSGVGKTYMMTLLANKAGIPVVQRKVAGASSEGYIGRNLSTVFRELYEKAKGQVDYGIIFLDEIDKLGGDPHFFGTRLQDEIIGWMDDGTVEVEVEKGKCTEIRTDNILYVGAGAFQGGTGYPSLDAIIKERLRRRQGVGFCKEEKKRYDKMPEPIVEDLIAYGLKPELLGRFSTHAVLQHLRREELTQILVGVETSPFRTNRRILEARGYTFAYDEDAAAYIVEQCPPETGARALASVTDRVFGEILFDPSRFASKGMVRLTADIAEEILHPDKEKRSMNA